MKKIFDWLKKSNRWKHLIGGIILGILSNSWYCSSYVGVTVASSLELKDKLWGGKWDWIDWIITILGSILSFAIKTLILLIL